ncbi:MAG: hypothetical protein KDD66_13175 [Bdellovibrionales bacterium]|nr:hypothetical protein [Bdellovibrionales bacterium]
MSKHAESAGDPCGDFGPTQKYALVWFFCVILGGVLLTMKLASIDSWMYANNGEFLDYQQYRENRRALTTIPSERVDPRQMGSIVTAEERIEALEK